MTPPDQDPRLTVMFDGSPTESNEKLVYPFADQLPNGAPEMGKPVQVADGVYWLRVPLPFLLNHINLWLLRDGEGWTVVDTGYRSPEVEACWENVFSGLFAGNPVTRVVVTHYHPDHVGQAGSLVRRFDARLWMTRTEFLYCRMLALDTWEEPPEEAIRFFHEAGVADDKIHLYRRRSGSAFRQGVSRLPISVRRIRDGEVLTIDGSEWFVVVGRGHAPEHASLWCPERKLLLSGDQVLPRISSNVSVHPTEPAANPLEEWLESCAHIRTLVPNDTLVLPAHNEPFYGLHARLSALIEGHEENLDALEALCATPKRATEVFPALFKRPIGDEQLFLAVGESLAHLNCLIGRGRLAREIGPDGVARYTATHARAAAAE